MGSWATILVSLQTLVIAASAGSLPAPLLLAREELRTEQILKMGLKKGP